MSNIKLRNKAGSMIAQFTNRAGMAALDGIKGHWTTVGKFNKPAFVVKEDMKMTFGEGALKMEFFIWKGYKFILEGE